MESQQHEIPAGWYPDAQLGAGGLRWWDGAQWTQHTHVPDARPAAPAPAPRVHEEDYDVVVKRHVAAAKAAMEADPQYLAKLRRARFIGLGVGALLGVVFWLKLDVGLPFLLLGGALFGVLLGPASYRWYVEMGARRKAHEAFMKSWAAARGWTWSAGCQQWRDVPFLRQGDDQTSGDCLSGELWQGVHGHIYNFTYEVEHTDSDGNDSTTYHHFTVLRAEVALGLPQLQVRPRAVSASRIFDRIKGGVTSRRPVRLESREFEERFVLEVDDAADELAVRTLFDPVLITHCLDTGKSFPALQANGNVIVFARKDHYDASDENGLAEIDELIAAVRPTVDRMAFNLRHFGAADAA
jgi:hypothetical protein